MSVSRSRQVSRRALIASILVAAGAYPALAVAAPLPTAFTVQVTGKGQPMILIPGLASSGAVWDSTVARYAQRYQCHVLSLAGFAGVPAVEGPLLKKVEQELTQYIADQKLNRPIIVGHSLGGFLALQLAANHPASVGKLVIVDSLPALGATQMPDITPEQLKSLAGRMREQMLSGDPATQDAARRATVATMVTDAKDVDRVVDWGVKSDRTTVVNAMHDLLATDLRADVARITAPTLVLGTWIAYKAYVPRAAVEGTFKTQYAKLAGVKIELADNARHFIMFDDAPWLFAQLDAFLK